MRQATLILILLPAAALVGESRPCVDPAGVSKYLNKDICVSAHVYDVVKLDDGARFLDVCPPQALDADCRFTILSLPQDWNEVGELDRYRDADVHVRGIVEPMHGRTAMVLSHARQFYGGPPKFRPNARLLHGFSGDTEKPAINDPNLKSHGHARTWMNSLDREMRTAK